MILTVGGAVARQATSDIPIVLAISADPIGIGLVASLARPGGNVTGLSIQTTDLAGKRLEILREVLPGIRRLAIMADVGLQSVALECGRRSGSGPHAWPRSQSGWTSGERKTSRPRFESITGRADALYVPPNPLSNANRVHINDLALRARLPAMFGFREYVESGGLVSYGPNVPELFRRSAEYVDKILRGAKPADMPVEQPTKFDLIVNLKTARSLSLELSPALLARADEVIE